MAALDVNFLVLALGAGALLFILGYRLSRRLRRARGGRARARRPRRPRRPMSWRAGSSSGSKRSRRPRPRSPTASARRRGRRGFRAWRARCVDVIRDKNASLETALAGLDQLRNRLRLLEQIGDPAEARSLYENLAARINALEAADPNPFAEISEQLTRLYAQKDATVETVFARLAPLEAKLAEVEGQLASRDPAAALERFGERLEAARAAQEAAVAALGERMRACRGGCRA